MTSRPFLLHYARVVLTEARRFRRSPRFHAHLLACAARARREAQQGQQRLPL